MLKTWQLWRYKQLNRKLRKFLILSVFTTEWYSVEKKYTFFYAHTPLQEALREKEKRYEILIGPHWLVCVPSLNKNLNYKKLWCVTCPTHHVTIIFISYRKNICISAKIKNTNRVFSLTIHFATLSEKGGEHPVRDIFVLDVVNFLQNGDLL